MSDQRFQSFEDFWPYYVREHSQKTTRTLHFVGTTLAGGFVAAAILTRRPSLLLAAPVVGYGLSWIGHFFVEKNKPATFQHPLWSFRGDMRMWRLIAAGMMDEEVERAMSSNGVHPEEPKAYAGAPDHAVN
jgi:hypothetical protein